MGHALRFLGLNPTEPQIREMIIEQNTPKGKLNYKQFVDSLESVRPCWKQNMLVYFLLWPLKWLPKICTLLCLDSLQISGKNFIETSLKGRGKSI